MGKLADRIAVITGGTSGIGRACARGFVAEGAKVVVAARRIAPGERLAAELGPDTMFIRTDVTQKSDIRALIEQTLDRFGHIDCVVSCAGAGSRTADIAGSAAADLEHDFSLHVRAAFLLTRYAAPSMVKRASGCFINMSSVSAHRAGFNAFGYEVAKAALVHFTRCAAIELGEHGVRVNSISPGPTLTNIFAPLAGESIEDDEVLAARAEAAFLQLLPSVQPQRGMVRAENSAPPLSRCCTRAFGRRHWQLGEPVTDDSAKVAALDHVSLVAWTIDTGARGPESGPCARCSLARMRACQATVSSARLRARMKSWAEDGPCSLYASS